MVQDGDGRGKAYCFQRSETTDSLERILSYLCDSNDTPKTKFVMVDKDLTKIEIAKCRNTPLLISYYEIF